MNTHNLTELTPSEFPIIYDLMLKSFAPIEVRPRGMQKALMDNPIYKIYISRDEKNNIIGFVTEWSFDKFNFLEHFAVHPDLRGAGTGSGIMKSYLNSVSKLVMIEVEWDDSEISARRINFYKRLGFHLNDYGYYQPFMRDVPGNMIFLKIMSYPDPITEADFLNFKKTVSREVYRTSLD